MKWKRGGETEQAAIVAVILTYFKTIPHNGSRIAAIAKGSERIFRLATRYESNVAYTGRTKADIMIAMTRSQMAIAETIDAFYGDSGANDGVSRSYKQAVADLDAETIKALDGPYRYAAFVVSGRPVLTR